MSEPEMTERQLRRPAGTITQFELERVFSARRHWKKRAERAEAELHDARVRLDDRRERLEALENAPRPERCETCQASRNVIWRDVPCWGPRDCIGMLDE